jgi:hypothetical protein
MQACVTAARDLDKRCPKIVKILSAKGSEFGHKSTPGIRICAMHQSGASMPSIPTDD